MSDRAGRLLGGLMGLLVGDALGVPYEFHHPSTLPPKGLLEMEPPPTFRRAHASVPIGTWSDDGAQALCLLASLLEVNRFDADDFAERLLAWFDRGYMAVDRVVFDVGNQTTRALTRLGEGARPLTAGPNGERDNGNGSLMRVLPLALWHRGSDRSLVEDAEAQSRVTHGHPRSLACCALTVLWGRALLEGSGDEAWDQAVETLRKLYQGRPALRHELEEEVLPFRGHGGSGYVVDTLHSARHVLEAGSYEAVVKAAIALGHDTDTTACVAGGLAGVRDGVEAIPRRWLETLRGRRLVEPLLDGLLARA